MINKTKFFAFSLASILTAAIAGCSGLNTRYEFTEVETEKGTVIEAFHKKSSTEIVPIIDFDLDVSIAVRHVPEGYTIVIQSAAHTWRVTGPNAKIIYRRVEGSTGVTVTVRYRKMYRAVYQNVRDGQPEVIKREFVDNEFLGADLD